MKKIIIKKHKENNIQCKGRSRSDSTVERPLTRCVQPVITGLMSAESSSPLPESELCFLGSVQTKAWRLWRASCPGLTRPRSFLRCLALAVPGSARVDLHRHGAAAGKGAL